MEYSEIILIALVLLVVFFGAQVPKVVRLLRSSKPQVPPVPVKTVLSAAKTTEMPAKKTVSTTKKKVAKKTVARKSTTKKATASKKAPAKKKTSKK